MGLVTARLAGIESAKPLSALEAELCVISLWKWSNGSTIAHANKVFKFKIWSDWGIANSVKLKDFLNTVEAGDGIAYIETTIRGVIGHVVIAAPGIPHKFSFADLARNMSSSKQKIDACRDMLRELYHQDMIDGEVDSYVRAYKLTLEN